MHRIPSHTAINNNTSTHLHIHTCIFTLHHHKEINVTEDWCDIRTCTDRELGFDEPLQLSACVVQKQKNVAKVEESGGGRGSGKKRLMQICEHTWQRLDPSKSNGAPKRGVQGLSSSYSLDPLCSPPVLKLQIYCQAFVRQRWPWEDLVVIHSTQRYLISDTMV